MSASWHQGLALALEMQLEKQSPQLHPGISFGVGDVSPLSLHLHYILLHFIIIVFVIIIIIITLAFHLQYTKQCAHCFMYMTSAPFKNSER